MTEEVFGLDKSPDDAWRIYLTLTPELREEEVYLYGLKWFDYRFLNPVDATYRFAHAYREAYKQAFKVNVDHERAEYVKGVRHEEIFDFSRRRMNDTTGLWKARKWADALCMPYDVFCRVAMEWATKRGSRKYLPRPTHLYNFDLLTAIQETWKQRQEARLHIAEDEAFKNENEWLMQQACLRENPIPALARLMYADDVLLESKVAARFGQETLDKARQYQV
jgi:hypothetical protein